MINKGVNAVGCGGFLANKVTSGAVDFAEFGVDRIGFLTVSGKLCPSGEKVLAMPKRSRESVLTRRTR